MKFKAMDDFRGAAAGTAGSEAPGNFTLIYHPKELASAALYEGKGVIAFRFAACGLEHHYVNRGFGMRYRNFSAFLAISAAGLLAACASSPSKDAPAATAKAPTTSMATPAAKPAAATAQADAAESANTRVSRAKYRQIERDGQTLYCRRVNKPGSKLASEDECLTAEEMKARAESSKGYADGVVTNSGVVGGTNINAGPGY